MEKPYAEAGHADVDARLVLLRAFRGDLVQKVEVRPGVLEDERSTLCPNLVKRRLGDMLRPYVNECIQCRLLVCVRSCVYVCAWYACVYSPITL